MQTNKYRFGRKGIMLTLAVSFAAGVTILLQPVAPAYALTITPQRIEMNGNRGDSAEQTFELYNESGKAQTYFLFTKDFEASNEEGEPNFIDDGDGLASWITITPTVTLAPQEHRKITFSVAIPKNIDAGGYFAGIFASPNQPNIQATAPGQVAVQGDLGVLILLQTDGYYKEDASILEFNTKNKQRVFTTLPVDFYFRFQNRGDSWAKPLGDVFIHNFIGKLTKSIGINVLGNNVLPASIRKFELGWFDTEGDVHQDPAITRPEKPKPGFWNQVLYEYHHFALGYYTADLTVTYGKSTTTTDRAKTSFWVFPWHLMLVSAIALLVIGDSLYVRIRNWRAKRKNK